MNLFESTIGELYETFDAITVKRISAYIQANGNSNTLRLHKLLAQWYNEKKFETHSLNDLKSSFYRGKSVVQSSFTTQISVLNQCIKEFILLSKINERNIYTEILWGEYLIEHKLKRNLIIKHSSYKLDIFNDEYPFLKDLYHKQEQKFLFVYNSLKINNDKIFEKLYDEIIAFNHFEIAKKIELYNTILSYNKNNQLNHTNYDSINQIIELGLKTDNVLIQINALALKLTINDVYINYISLKNQIINDFNLFPINILTQISSIILNFGLSKMDKGDLNYSIENYKFYLFLEENNILFSSLFFNQTHMNRYITLCIKHDSIERARAVLDLNIHLLPKNQIESCFNLNEAKIEFAEKNYKLAFRLLYQVNTNILPLYLPLTKILLLKVIVESEDDEMMSSEKENLYKHYHYSKTLNEEIKQRYILFHKYVENLLAIKYKFMSEYIRKKMIAALSDDSPYFTEKEWMQGRWKYLEETYG